jgi:hypothetical protein
MAISELQKITSSIHEEVIEIRSQIKANDRQNQAVEEYMNRTIHMEKSLALLVQNGENVRESMSNLQKSYDKIVEQYNMMVQSNADDSKKKIYWFFTTVGSIVIGVVLKSYLGG